jgi:dolichol-phosphate mannosyltransferase
VPVYNEADNVEPLVLELDRVLRNPALNLEYEIVYVDDGSTDGTPERLAALAADLPRLRVVRHRYNCGQSAAIRSGVRAARHAMIATLDGDGQNDPADIPRLLTVFASGARTDVHLVVGCRVNRRDTWLRRISSRIANAIRSTLAGDSTPDTGCGLKVFSRDVFLALPFFDHMHRFLPALVIREKGRVVSLPVNHRPRTRGKSKYGVRNRMWVGIVDLLGVLWLQRRAARPVIVYGDRL